MSCNKNTTGDKIFIVTLLSRSDALIRAHKDLFNPFTPIAANDYALPFMGYPFDNVGTLSGKDELEFSTGPILHSPNLKSY